MARFAKKKPRKYNEGMINFGNQWDELLRQEWEKEYCQKLKAFLIEEYKKKTVYPDKKHIFNALKTTSYEAVKVLILGQDPYHEPGQAHGLSFSVPTGMKQPPSLQNIFKELEYDLACKSPKDGNLEKWAQEGVLLLNTVLTVEAHKPHSHKERGWETFTDKIIALLGGRKDPMVFILWGKYAKAKKPLINQDIHLILEGVHPSPLSAYRGFFGGRYFSKANEFLKEPVNWQL